MFAVSRFENRNGAISWRVDGRLNGLRIRRNFKTQEEAAAEKATLDLKALQLDSGMRSVPTFLTEDQVREAETAFSRLKDSSRTLSFCVDYTLANYQEPESQKPLKDAVAAYLATKDHELEQDHISESHLVFLKRSFKRLLRHFPKVTVAELTTERLIVFFNLGNPSNHQPINHGGASDWTSSRPRSTTAGNMEEGDFLHVKAW